MLWLNFCSGSCFFLRGEIVFYVEGNRIGIHFIDLGGNAENLAKSWMSQTK
jgi:hypothetical protein